MMFSSTVVFSQGVVTSSLTTFRFFSLNELFKKNFNSMIKAEKHKKKLSEVLEINLDKIWALEIK